MSVAFSSEESEPIKRNVDILDTDIKDETIPFEEMYELERCVNWIQINKFSKIALQFPDSLLGDAFQVSTRLKDLTNNDIFILGDTPYGSCCVNELTALRLPADAIIHYGHACLSPTKRLPVLYVFGKYSIDICDTVNSFRSIFLDNKCLVAILYEVAYSFAIDKIYEKLEDYENVIMSKLEIPGEDYAQNKTDSNNLLKVTKNHRHFFIPKIQTLDNYSIFYIGTKATTMTNFMHTLPNCCFHSYNPAQRKIISETIGGNKLLKKRYYYIEKAKDANIIGILVGTLAVLNYLDTINHLKELIKNAGKKYYTISVGKISNVKLANYPEIDVFVNIACSESTLIDSREFYKPIITPYELEMSLNQARKWSGEYILDFCEILPGAEGYVPFCENSVISDVSLVTGKVRHIGLCSEETSLEESETAIATRNNMEVSSICSQSAGQFLLQRSWKGLEQKLGETPSATIEEGKCGIASGYDDEYK